MKYMRKDLTVATVILIVHALYCPSLTYQLIYSTALTILIALRSARAIPRSSWVMSVHAATALWAKHLSLLSADSSAFQTASLRGFLGPAALWGTVLTNESGTLYLLAVLAMTALWVFKPSLSLVRPAGSDLLFVAGNLLSGVLLPCLINRRLFIRPASDKDKDKDGAPLAVQQARRNSQENRPNQEGVASGCPAHALPGSSTYRPLFSLHPKQWTCKIDGLRPEELSLEDRQALLRALQKEVGGPGSHVEVALTVRAGCVMLEVNALKVNTSSTFGDSSDSNFEGTEALTRLDLSDLLAHLPPALRQRVTHSRVLDTAQGPRITQHGPLQYAPGHTAATLPLLVTLPEGSEPASASSFEVLAWLDAETRPLDASRVSCRWSWEASGREASLCVEVPCPYRVVRGSFPSLLTVALAAPGPSEAPVPLSNRVHVPLLPPELQADLSRVHPREAPHLLSDLTATLMLRQTGKPAALDVATCLDHMGAFCAARGLRHWTPTLDLLRVVPRVVTSASLQSLIHPYTLTFISPTLETKFNALHARALAVRCAMYAPLQMVICFAGVGVGPFFNALIREVLSRPLAAALALLFVAGTTQMLWVGYSAKRKPVIFLWFLVVWGGFWMTQIRDAHWRGVEKAHLSHPDPTASPLAALSYVASMLGPPIFGNITQVLTLRFPIPYSIFLTLFQGGTLFLWYCQDPKAPYPLQLLVLLTLVLSFGAFFAFRFRQEKKDRLAYAASLSEDKILS